MPVLTKKPSGVNTAGTWAFNTTGLFQDVADASDASYVVNGTLADNLYLDYEDITEFSSGALINALTVNSRFQNPSAGADGSMIIKTIFSTVGAVDSPDQAPGAGFIDYPFVMTASVLGKTVADFNSSVFGGRETNFVINPLRLVKQSVDIDVAPPAGAWASFAGLWWAGLIGAGLGMEHMPALVRDLYRRHQIRVKRDEYAELLEAFRAPRRSYC